MSCLGAAAAVVAALGSAPNAAAEITGVVATPIGGEFDAPVFVTSAPGHPKLMFVVEQGGVVEVMRRGRQLDHHFLDISQRVSAGGEQGLLSIAFPPDYRESRRFYLYFTNRDCGASGGCDIEVAEYRRSRTSRTRARPRSHRRVIAIPHRDAANHNGGTVMFGPDGRLWLATGDGGGGNDTFDNARHRSSLLGKLLRVNPRPSHPGEPGYRIPPNNPFVGEPGRDEIWSLGLRNPFRFSFDDVRGSLAIGDVGQAKWEEINFVGIADAKGANFGWPQFEGDEEVDPGRPPPGDPLPLIDPIYTYPNPALGQAAVIGGVVVRDPRFATIPAIGPSHGRYLFADAYAGAVQSINPETGGGYHELPNADVPSPAGFGADSRRRVHVAALGDGRIYRLDPSP